MADEELEAIRARRMAELQAQYGVRQCMDFVVDTIAISAPSAR